MKFGTAYKSHLNDPVKQDETVSKEETGQELSKQLKIEWLSSPVTEEKLKLLTKERDELLVKAISCAKTYSEHQNHLRIVDALIRVDELNKQLNTYKEV